eukprot:14423071-Alexandrium_andersonii.AAC.1
MAVVASPKWARNRSAELSRGTFCAVVRAEPEYDNENISGARSGRLFELSVEVTIITITAWKNS